METSNNAIELIKSFEGFKAEAYYDSVGVLTIGYGTTRNIKSNMIVNKAQAHDLLTKDVVKFESFVNRFVRVNLTQNQFDSLISWTYNLGPTNLKNSTMLKVLNQEKYDEVPFQMKRWNKAGGKVLLGLTRRREAEANLFAKT